VLVAENGAINVDPCPTQNKINRNVMSVWEQNATHAANFKQDSGWRH
jgi:hypothetical protein